MIEEFVKQNKKYCKQEIIGLSEKDSPIKALYLRKGNNYKRRAMLISCLHGNEKRTIQTNLEVLEYILVHDLLNYWDIASLPVPNPDGTELGIRYNANNIDLNRDFFKTEAKETKEVIRLYQDFKPEITIDYHWNLSGKRPFILIPPKANKKANLCKSILFSYEQIREETNLLNTTYISDIDDKIIASLLIRGVYKLNKTLGLFIEYAAKESKIPLIIEECDSDLSLELSTELLKEYIKI